MIPENLSSALLLVGSGVGVSALRTLFEKEVPGLHIRAIEAPVPFAVDEIRTRILNEVAQHKPAALVLASGVLWASMADGLKAALGDIPVFGVSPALAQASRLSCTRHVAVLGRPELLSNPAYAQTSMLYIGRGLRITNISTADLVYPAHRLHERGVLPDISMLREFVGALREDQRIDTVVLACTHAHVLRPLLEKALFRPFYWVDSALLAVARVREALSQTQEAQNRFLC